VAVGSTPHHGKCSAAHRVSVAGEQHDGSLQRACACRTLLQQVKKAGQGKHCAHIPVLLPAALAQPLVPPAARRHRSCPVAALLQPALQPAPAQHVPSLPTAPTCFISGRLLCCATTSSPSVLGLLASTRAPASLPGAPSSGAGRLLESVMAPTPAAPSPCRCQAMRAPRCLPPLYHFPRLQRSVRCDTQRPIATMQPPRLHSRAPAPACTARPAPATAACSPRVVMNPEVKACYSSAVRGVMR